MAEKVVKKVNVCKKCSGIDVEELKGMVKTKDLRLGCIGNCKKNSGKSFGFLNGELVVCDTKDEFWEKVKAVL